MVAYIFCLTASGGVPVFARNKNGLKPLPFPVIGSLNGVHMFARSHDVELVSTITDDSKIVWKSFHDSLTLIVIAEDDDADDCHLGNILLYVFEAMVMLLGFDDVTNIKNVERFKKDVRVCFPLIDRFIEDHDLLTFGDLVNAADVIAAPENTVLQSFLDAFAECADSPYGCLLVHGKISVATRKWWSLTSRELVLISALISSFSPSSSRDVPVFLPDASPSNIKSVFKELTGEELGEVLTMADRDDTQGNARLALHCAVILANEIGAPKGQQLAEEQVPHRLMTFQLTRHVEACVLCGPSPSLADLEEEVGRFWRTGYDSLRAVLQNHPSNIPSHTVLDSNLLGFLLVNVETNRCLCSVHPPSTDDETLEVYEKRHILRSYYKHVVGNFFSSKIEGSEKGPSDFTHSAMDTYITTDTHKCYAMLSPPHQIYVLYNTSIPTFAMRSITEKTLQILTRDKSTQL